MTTFTRIYHPCPVRGCGTDRSALTPQRPVQFRALGKCEEAMVNPKEGASFDARA